MLLGAPGSDSAKSGCVNPVIMSHSSLWRCFKAHCANIQVLDALRAPKNEMQAFAFGRAAEAANRDAHRLPEAAFQKFVSCGCLPPLSRHASAFRALCQYRKDCLDGSYAPQEQDFTYLCLSGVHLQKCLDSAATTPEDDIDLIQGTIARLFVLAVEMYSQLNFGSFPGLDQASFVEGWLQGSSARPMQHKSCSPEDRVACATTACLQLELKTTVPVEEGRLRSEIPVTFFRAASTQLMEDLLSHAAGSQGDNCREFVSLEKSSFINSPETPHLERILTLVGIAESEAGQSLLRDTILSITLPRKVVGCRGTYLLHRTTNKAATIQNTELVTEAHNAAMCGALWCWDNKEDVVLQTAAVLAGLGVFFCGTSGSISKSLPYDARVLLPWICAPPNSHFVKGVRLFFSPTCNTWTAFSYLKNSEIKIHSRARGVKGLVWAVSIILNDDE
jgi:hypothetical protein